MIVKEVVSMILDEIKAVSDDSLFNENHCIYLIGKYRAFLIKKEYLNTDRTYRDLKKIISVSNYQTICMNLMQVPAISGESCEGGVFLKSNIKIPSKMEIGTVNVFPIDFTQAHIEYVPQERFKFTGTNKWLKNIIYCTEGPDGYMYFKSSNPQFLYMENVRMQAVFEDFTEASKYQCREDNSGCPIDIMEQTVPMEDSMIPELTNLIVKELLNSVYRPEDNINNANDDLSKIASTKQNS